MKNIQDYNYDIIIIGAGHSGIEAALAAARLGMRTACFTMDLYSVANMPCNPSIGGTGKGHLVRELDALGGEMARAADKACIQFRMLNRAKGPAVHSLRAQADRQKYKEIMLETLKQQENLTLIEAEVTAILVCRGHAPEHPIAADTISCSKSADTHSTSFTIVTQAYKSSEDKTNKPTQLEYSARAVVICSGTYMDARTLMGENIRTGGPDGMRGATALGESLKSFGLNFQRFKTGTPPRLDARTIDFSKMEIQSGDEPPPAFSFETKHPLVNSAVCWLAYTNMTTNDISRENLHRSPTYSGMIEGVGARYCPSYEDKVVRFADKDRHQLFLEPMGLGSENPVATSSSHFENLKKAEPLPSDLHAQKLKLDTSLQSCDIIYLQGMSTAMPEDVQLKMIRSVPGMENAEIIRPGYAIEYDCIDPLELHPTLETKKVPGLYGAGQFCGSSGYEEAAVQGFVAGVNAALKLNGSEPLIIGRNDGYIGTLIDDLVTKGTNEPYRMMTSRSEYRLLHRQDNADFRMSHFGHRIGLISDERHLRVLSKYEAVKREIKRLETTFIPPTDELNLLLVQYGMDEAKTGVSLASLLRRPRITYTDIASFDTNSPDLSAPVREQAEISIRYEGYIKRQERQLDELIRLEGYIIPDGIDYNTILGLRTEARQKLSSVRPRSLGQAMRISGVSPADAAALMIHLKS